MHYARDVPEEEPQRIWLFDEPIVIARRPGKIKKLDLQIYITSLLYISAPQYV